jgi:hypothetical protein
MARRTRKTDTENTGTDTLVADEVTTDATEESNVTALEGHPLDASEENGYDEDATVEVADEAPPVEEVTEEVVEGASEASTDEAEALESKGGKDKDDKPADEPVDLTDFEAAVEAAIEGHDNDTGTVPEALIAPVTAEYRKLSGAKAKGAAKRRVDDLMKAGMADMNIGLARAYMVLSDNLTAGPAAKKEREEKPPADPTQAHLQRVGGLQLAHDLVVQNVPEGVAENWEDQLVTLLDAAQNQAAEYTAWLDREDPAEGEEDTPEPEVPSWVKAAVKLSRGKSAKVTGVKTRTATVGGGIGDGIRRDIGEHIRQAFENVESGTFLTISQIRAFKGTEYPHDNPPSAGAISARLFPKGDKACSLEFVRPGTSSDGKANKGATKV